MIDDFHDFQFVILHRDAGSRKEKIGAVTGFPLRRGNDNSTQCCELIQKTKTAVRQFLFILV